MKQNTKNWLMICLSFIQNILTIVLFTAFVAYSGLPGGEVGMAPVLVMIASVIEFPVSIGSYFLFKNYLDGNRRYLFFIINACLYQLACLLISNAVPVANLFESGTGGFLNRSYTYSTILATALMIIVISIPRRLWK